MDVISGQHPSDDLFAVLRTHLTANIADPQLDATPQNLLAILGRPNEVVAVIKDAMLTRGILHGLDQRVDTKWPIIGSVAIFDDGRNGKRVMATDELTANADKDCYQGEEIVASEEADISIVFPKSMTSNATARGQFGKANFPYERDLDVYVCPVSESLA